MAESQSQDAHNVDAANGQDGCGNNSLRRRWRHPTHPTPRWRDQPKLIKIYGVYVIHLLAGAPEVSDAPPFGRHGGRGPPPGIQTTIRPYIPMPTLNGQRKETEGPGGQGVMLATSAGRDLTEQQDQQTR